MSADALYSIPRRWLRRLPRCRCGVAIGIIVISDSLFVDRNDLATSHRHGCAARLETPVQSSLEMYHGDLGQ